MLEHFPTNLDHRDGADFGSMQGRLAQEYVDISSHPDAAVGQNRPAPQGLIRQVCWQRYVACRGNQPLPRAAPRQQTCLINHDDPDWSESALGVEPQQVVHGLVEAADGGLGL